MAIPIEELKNKIVYIYDNKNIYYKDIVETIRNAGVKQGDTICVHADLAVFGKLGEIIDRCDFVNVFIEAFLEVLGKDGTIITPAYSYSFCNNEIYDPDTSIAKAGLFSEEFRKRNDAYRSLNPIFSVAAIGRKAKELTTNLSKNSFGKGSVFDKLQHINNSKYVIVGVNYFVCTHVHYIERMAMVPYRYIKKFKGKIRHKGKTYEYEYEFYVRHLNINTNTTFDKIENHLFKLGLLKKAPLGGDFISCAKISDIYREGMEMLKKDPLFFLKNKPEYDKL